MASVVQESVQNWRARLKELEAQIAPLAQEAGELRHAISLHPNNAGTRRGASARRAAGTARPSKAATAATKRTAPRANPGGAKRRIVDALQDKPGLTSGEVAARTGLRRGTVATAMSKMAAQGQLRKAKRGYQIP